jgi:hypothetical protein
MKPSNVLLASDGQIYLADFGLARIAQSGESTLTSDMVLGTPQYISPEQALGKKDLDEGTDIYSYGVMLYEMTVGKVPFSADTPFSIIHDHIYTPLPMPRVVNPAVPEEVERVLLKALAKERSDRYKDVKSLVKAYTQAWQGGMSGIIPAEQAGRVRLETEAPTLPPIPLEVPSGTEVETHSPPYSNQATPPEEAAEALPRQVAAESGEERKRRRKIPWMWMALVVLLVFGCIALLWAFGTTRKYRNFPSLRGTAQTPEIQQTTPSLSEIDRAVQAIEENPNDPATQVKLALAYHRAGLPEQEQNVITEVESLFASDEDFFWDAVRQTAGNGAWLSAARLAVDGATLHLETNPSLPVDLSNLIHETVYKAMKDILAVDYLTSNRLMQIDPPLSQLAKARYTFFYGDKAIAQQLLDELFQTKPGFPDAQLLQADFSSRSGDPEKARQSLTDLRANPGMQAWMQQEAQIIEGTLP